MIGDKKKHIAIIGSTGSIGTQTLSLLKDHLELFSVHVLTAGSNAELLIKQAIEFLPAVVVIGEESKYLIVKDALASYPVEVLAGTAPLSEVVTRPMIDIVLTAVVGFVGLEPTVAAIKAGKQVALANKETLVVAGELIMEMAKKHGVKILPVDSEHSAIFQCLQGEKHESIEKLYLTASGGPFRSKDKDFLSTVNKKDALKHPNWVMGQKITIDSASMMNKGLEVIEAKWLFDLDVNQIDVIVHPQSVIHSMVQFNDGSIKAQMGVPDMKLPIQYALAYPNRIKNRLERFSFLNYPNLTFEMPDMVTFRNLALAYEALRRGGNIPCALNAANEVAVAAFLNDKIGFLEMSDIIAETIMSISYLVQPDLSDYFKTDTESRAFAVALVTNRKKVYQIEK